MPTEERYITFELDEIYKAVLISSIQKNMDELPGGTIVSMKLDDGDDTVTVNLKDKQGDIKEIGFDRVFFVQALVLYCQGSGIPLPKHSQKVLNIMEDKILLRIEVDRAA